jgi:hypothetical protein
MCAASFAPQVEGQTYHIVRGATLRCAAQQNGPPIVCSGVKTRIRPVRAYVGFHQLRIDRQRHRNSTAGWRRLGVLIDAQRKTIGLAKGRRGAGRPKIGGVPKTPPKSTPTLADAGIDKNLAKRARRAAAMSAEDFVACFLRGEGRGEQIEAADRKAQIRQFVGLLKLGNLPDIS